MGQGGSRESEQYPSGALMPPAITMISVLRALPTGLPNCCLRRRCKRLCCLLSNTATNSTKKTRVNTRNTSWLKGRCGQHYPSPAPLAIWEVTLRARWEQAQDALPQPTHQPASWPLKGSGAGAGGEGRGSDVGKGDEEEDTDEGFKAAAERLRCLSPGE